MLWVCSWVENLMSSIQSLKAGRRAGSGNLMGGLDQAFRMLCATCALPSSDKTNP